MDALSQPSLTSTIVFATKEEARLMLSQNDEFTESWSQFDIDSRMQEPGSIKEELFSFIDDQVKSWTTKEQQEIKQALRRIDKKILDHKAQIDLPDTIYLIKTTGKEEGDATAYTRGNYIVFKEGMSTKHEFLDHLILHELFHVLSRHNTQFRAAMYEIIGFQIMNSIDYPAQIRDARITNPDAPQTDAFIRLKSKNISSDYMMILYADKPYTEGRFFDYLNIGFLKLTGADEKAIDLENGEPQILGMKGVDDFYEQVGRNTKYIIHPEEIMAENFALALNNKEDLPNPEISKAIIIKLKVGGFLD